MYPQQYFGLFPAAPVEPRVFVAMAFDERHRARWDAVIKPAIESVGLEAFRVDAARVSDSILTEILQGIGTAKLVFAEVSPIDGHRRPNVFYEVGIAHAARQAKEVVVFRDDHDRLPFDIANVRVNHYDPDSDPEGAKEAIYDALTDGLRELDLAQSMAADYAARRLDQSAFNLLLAGATIGRIDHPERKNMRQALASAEVNQSIRLLLELGLIQPLYPDFRKLVSLLGTPSADEPARLDVSYELTPIGKSVLQKIALDHGFDDVMKDPDAVATLDLLAKKQPAHDPESPSPV